MIEFCLTAVYLYLIKGRWQPCIWYFLAPLNEHLTAIKHRKHCCPAHNWFTVDLKLVYSNGMSNWTHLGPRETSVRSLCVWKYWPCPPPLPHTLPFPHPHPSEPACQCGRRIGGWWWVLWRGKYYIPVGVREHTLCTTNTVIAIEQWRTALSLWVILLRL